MFLYGFVSQRFSRPIDIFYVFGKLLEIGNVLEITATVLLIFTKYVMKIGQNKVERVSNILFDLLKEKDDIAWLRGDTRILFECWTSGSHQSVFSKLKIETI